MIVQADVYNQTTRQVVVAEVTKSLALASDPAGLFIDLATPEGQATGLLQNSVVSCLLLATINADRIDRVIGTLSASLRQRLDHCLKAALELT